MLLGLLLTPTVAGLLAFAIRPDGLRRGLLFITALLHTGLLIAAWMTPPAPLLGGWLWLDAVGRVFLGITSVLFFTVAVYGLSYLQREHQTTHADFEEGFLFVDAPEARFTGCLLLFLAAMTLVTVSQHFGILWVAIEATTLASAPLIFFHRHHRSLEATWKYLLICSVGIALALLGTFFLAIAATQADGSMLPLAVPTLVQEAARLHDTWLAAAFLLLLVGYGTKMGLAPLHTWLPDAHSEAPSHGLGTALWHALELCLSGSLPGTAGVRCCWRCCIWSRTLHRIWSTVDGSSPPYFSKDKRTINGYWPTQVWNIWGSWHWVLVSAVVGRLGRCCTPLITH